MVDKKKVVVILLKKVKKKLKNVKKSSSYNTQLKKSQLIPSSSYNKNPDLVDLAKADLLHL
jgi:hypothetical protein